MRAHVRLLGLIGWLALPGILASGSGCGLLYKHTYTERCFTLYSDRSETYLKRVASKVERIYEGLGAVFKVPRERLGHPTILLEGVDTDVVDFHYSPDILGCYIPFLNLISVECTSAPRESETIDSVLLHEIAHHFISTQWPAATSECWLNEGLASALETSLFDADGFEFPLLNPELGQIAHHSARGKEPLLRLPDLLAMSWSQFHDRERRDRNYALAWALVYYLLNRHLPADMPLGEKIDALYQLDRGEIARLEPKWIQFLRSFDLNGGLLDYARDTGSTTRRTARWAIETLGRLSSGEDLRLLEGLAELFDSPDFQVRVRAHVAFLQRLDRATHSYVLEHEVVHKGIARIKRALRDSNESRSLSLAIVDAAGECRRTQADWVPCLVDLLDSTDGEVRAAAASALSRMSAKPTIVNPDFWREGTPKARGAEIAEWRAWLLTLSEQG